LPPLSVDKYFAKEDTSLQTALYAKAESYKTSSLNCCLFGYV